MRLLTGLAPLMPYYDAFLLDLWGVIHDGSYLYPGVHEALIQLRQAGKKIIFISNAPRRAWKVEKVLHRLGIESALYDHAVSSGEAGYRWLESGGAGWGKRYYYIGPEGSFEWTDSDILDGLDYTRVMDVSQADFLLNVGFGSEEQTAQDLTPLLQQAQEGRIPMLCLNPDLEVVKISGERYPCAGVIAHAYRDMGGEVTWFGKPYPAIYEWCMAQLGGLPKNRILAIGDSLETDIPGANRFGIDSVLVTGGILKEHSQLEIAAMCGKRELMPTYVMPQLAW